MKSEGLVCFLAAAKAASSMAYSTRVSPVDNYSIHKRYFSGTNSCTLLWRFVNHYQQPFLNPNMAVYQHTPS